VQKHPLDLVGKVNGRGWYLPWYKRDPKKPNGPPIPVILAEAETGEITRRSDNPEIVMHVVRAKLFQKGVHAANIQAATVHADQQAEKIVATGRCRVVSLTNPADTVLTADKITWDTRNTNVIAEGHARVAKRPRDGGVPITQEGGKIVYDLEHNTVTVR
jgi:lipopolysaccharide assembly outer membrane protein LptD (OstA)